MTLLTEAIYIDDNDKLAHIMPELQAQSFLAVDTEFIRVSTFFPKPALVQIATDQHIYFIDPLTITDFTGLVDIFESNSIVKVFHSAKEDVEVIKTLTGASLNNLFDSQLAHAFLTDTRFISYQNLVDHYLQVQIEKGESRSDWLARPLSESQLSYAADDVKYLREVYEPLKLALHEKMRAAYFDFECDKLLSDTLKDHTLTDDYYLDIKLAWRLDNTGLKILKLICQWREQIIRQIDSPRKSFLSTQNVFDIAKMRPKTMYALSKIPQIKPRIIKKYGTHILALVQKALNDSVDVAPELVYRPLSPKYKKLLSKVRSVFHHFAVSEGIAIELIYKKHEIEWMLNHFIRHGEWQWTNFYQDWRKASIEAPLMNVLENYQNAQR